MKSKIMGLLTMGMLAGPIAAQAAVTFSTDTATDLVGTFSVTGTSVDSAVPSTFDFGLSFCMPVRASRGTTATAGSMSSCGAPGTSDRSCDLLPVRVLGDHDPLARRQPIRLDDDGHVFPLAQVVDSRVGIGRLSTISCPQAVERTLDQRVGRIRAGKRGLRYPGHGYVGRRNCRRLGQLQNNGDRRPAFPCRLFDQYRLYPLHGLLGGGAGRSGHRTGFPVPPQSRVGCGPDRRRQVAAHTPHRQ